MSDRRSAGETAGKRESDADRHERGAKLFGQMIGAESADQMRAAWREISPELDRYITEFVAGDIWSRAGLDLRTKSLVTIAALAAMGRTLALELNLRMARNNGATREEVTETLLQIAPYAGFPAVWEGLAMAHRVYGEQAGDTADSAS